MVPDTRAKRKIVANFRRRDKHAEIAASKPPKVKKTSTFDTQQRMG
jgi:hypothetical protein